MKLTNWENNGAVRKPVRKAAMLILDTNHLRELSYQSQIGLRLQDRLESARVDAVITVVSAEELLKGRLARIAAAHDGTDLTQAYERLTESILFIADYTIVLWDDEAAARFAAFRAQGLRIGTLDLRIACITLEHDATLLSRNTVDFAKVPGLRLENWLD